MPHVEPELVRAACLRRQLNAGGIHTWLVMHDREQSDRGLTRLEIYFL